jgi:hypothetical protein
MSDFTVRPRKQKKPITLAQSLGIVPTPVAPVKLTELQWEEVCECYYDQFCCCYCFLINLYCSFYSILFLCILFLLDSSNSN